MKPTWDPTGEYSLPWQTGFGGIAYNIDVTGRELTSTDDLFDPAFKGKIGMLTEMRDTMGLIMMSLGHRHLDAHRLRHRRARLRQARAGQERRTDPPLHRQRLHERPRAPATSPPASAGPATWCSSPATIRPSGSSSPRQGGTAWADTMVLPKGAENRDAAAKWMDFVYDPVQAAQITAWVQYISPVAGVQEELAKIDPELAENPLLFPDEETIARTHIFANLPEDVEAEYDAAFSAITGA